MWILELTFFSCLSRTGRYKLQQKSPQVSFMEKDLKTKEGKLQQNHDRIHTQKTHQKKITSQALFWPQFIRLKTQKLPYKW